MISYNCQNVDLPAGLLRKLCLSAQSVQFVNALGLTDYKLIDCNQTRKKMQLKQQRAATKVANSKFCRPRLSINDLGDLCRVIALVY